MQIDDYIPITKAKSMLLNVLRNFENKENTIAITKNGVPKAVIMSMEQFEGMCETLEILSDKNLMRQIQGSLKDFENDNELVDIEALN